MQASLSFQRLVVKLGTQVVIDTERGGPALDRLRGIITELAFLIREGKEVVLVSSGAVGLGRQALSLSGTLTLEQKQACAAVGQSFLMNTYRDLLSPYGITPAQILLTADDFTHRNRYLALTQTLQALVSLRTLPIINENDVVSIAGLRETEKKSFDDNDKLSALVAGKLNADLLLILTNVDGVYTDNPQINPAAQKIDEITRSEISIRTSGTSSHGRGGMESKLASAKLAGMCGVTTIISSGFIREAVQSALLRRGGTIVHPFAEISQRKRWIGLSSGYVGILTVDAKAREALLQRGASLLPVGVVKADGDFLAQDIVSIQDLEGREIGRGMVEIDAHVLQRILGKRSQEAKRLVPSLEKDVVIHKDNLVVFEEKEEREGKKEGRDE